MAQPTLIFDLDDTLVTTAQVWTAAEKFMLQTLKLECDEQLLLQLSGRSARDVAGIIHQRAGSRLSRGGLELRFVRMLHQAMKQAPLAPKPGAIGLLRHRSAGWKKVIASGSPRAVIATVLSRLEISDCFELVVSSDEVGEGKPSPKVFLEAARRAGAARDECLVVEDSIAGVQAAKNAGLACFAVPSRIETRAQIEALADRTFASLAELELPPIPFLRSPA